MRRESTFWGEPAQSKLLTYGREEDEGKKKGKS